MCKIRLSLQALFAESDPAFFGPPSDKITLVNGQFNVTATLSNVPAPITNSSTQPLPYPSPSGFVLRCK